MKVVVTSDQHLGYANADKTAFNTFLDNLSQRSDVTHLDLNRPSYPLQFTKEVNLTDGQVNYRLVHGYEFDPEQKVPFMAFLCRVMSDTEGALESNLWVDFNHLNSVFSKIEPSFMKTDLAKISERLRRRPEDRLKDSLD